MKNIIITGAGGLVATELTTELLSNGGGCNLFLISTHPDMIEMRYKKYMNYVRCFTLDTFAEYMLTSNVVFDICIHTAFSRSERGDLIISSLGFQRRLLSCLGADRLKAFVNISSQSVYGKLAEPLWTEDTPLEPASLYAIGKYSSELITELLLQNTGIRWANLRLSSICGNARFVRVFVQNAINGVPIRLTTPDQICSFIDVRDVATALMAIIRKSESLENNHIFNIGANLTNTIRSVALLVKEVGESYYHTPEVVITEEDSGKTVKIGMNATHFMEEFSWKPRYNMKDMIVSLFEMLKNTNNEDSLNIN